MRFLSLSISVTLLLLLLSCGNNAKPKNTGSKTATVEDSIDKPTTVLIEENLSATCLWPKVGLRDIPGRNGAKYLTTIYFGEVVEYLEITDKAADGKEYIKVKLSDGTEGWVNSILFAVGGKLGIVEKTTEVYKRPDVMTFQGDKLEATEMIVILPTEKGNWQEFVGFERDKKGWIQKMENIVFEELDVKMGVLLQRAEEEEGEKRNQLLKNIVDNPNFKNTKLIDMVKNRLSVYEDEEAFIDNMDFEDLAVNELGITATSLNVRSEPVANADNVIFQVTQGDICTILTVSATEEVVNGNVDSWYKIRFNGQEGWIFGHHTTKRSN